MVSLIPLYAAIVAAVHTTVSADIGSYFLEQFTVLLVQEFDKMRSGTSDKKLPIGSKICSNYLLFLCYLYNFKVVHSQLVVDVMFYICGIPSDSSNNNNTAKTAELSDNLREVIAELLTVLLDHCGQSIRSDDPLAIKQVISFLQQTASQGEVNVRYKALLEAITDLKNNKSKRNQSALMENVKATRKWLGAIKSGRIKPSSNATSSSVTFKLSLSDLLQAETKGRWWKAGAQWQGHSESRRSDAGDDARKERVVLGDMSIEGQEKLNQLAKKLKLCQRSWEENEAFLRMKTEFLVQLDGAGTDVNAQVISVIYEVMFMH